MNFLYLQVINFSAVNNFSVHYTKLKTQLWIKVVKFLALTRIHFFYRTNNSHPELPIVPHACVLQENYRMGGSYKWPRVGEVVEYRRKVREVIRDIIRDTPLDLPINMKSPWVRNGDASVQKISSKNSF